MNCKTQALVVAFVCGASLAYSQPSAIQQSLTKAIVVYGHAASDSLWSGFGEPCQTSNSADPNAQYDKIADRLVFTQHATPSGGPYYQCVAVSTTSDATGSYYRYAFPLPHYFPDYPKLAVWPDGYYVSINLQDPTRGFVQVGALVCGLDRNSMLSGLPAASVCFQTTSTYSSLLPSDLDGSTLPPSGSPDYYVNLGANSLNLWQFHVDFQTPT